MFTTKVDLNDFRIAVQELPAESEEKKELILSLSDDDLLEADCAEELGLSAGDLKILISALHTMRGYNISPPQGLEGVFLCGPDRSVREFIRRCNIIRS